MSSCRGTLGPRCCWTAATTAAPKSGSSPAENTCVWLSSIRSMRVEPVRGMPRMKIGSVLVIPLPVIAPAGKACRIQSTVARSVRGSYCRCRRRALELDDVIALGRLGAEFGAIQVCLGIARRERDRAIVVVLGGRELAEEATHVGAIEPVA